jgi:transcriptional regulator with XRE-family HTH domain
METKQKICLIRKALGWSQEAVGASIGIDQRTYGRMENGESKFTISRLEQLCEQWGITHVQFASLDVEKLYELILETRKKNRPPDRAA